MPYFRKVLIANRGEIARRVIRTCRRLGIRTVAVYSEADRALPFAREADEAVLIGPPPAAQSYMAIEKILDAAEETGAEAVHPGYGFLAENPLFARRCAERGLVFIGPRPEVIEAMGSKLASRQLMRRAGVPVIPGWDEPLPTLAEAQRVAGALGFPLLLKASAGGGGIGMHLVSSPDELERAFDSARERAQRYFGDGTLYFERLVPGARHIEVQVARDSHGAGVHLFERECSIQRRHQKVIEETPSPFLDAERRAALCEAALRGAEAIDYTNVGTIEFVFDQAGQFYFLEMNTRLQVEHPITEETTGVDLVELQLRIAAGQPLGLAQEGIRQEGHAIECRVYAEDPQTFLPSPGTITRMELPEGARYEFGYEEGNAVTPYYDPLIGKVITRGATRSEAIERMIEALRGMRIEGIKTNLPLLLAVCQDASFQSGRYDTSFLSRPRSGQ
ncbi:ATP-grasp domain-containing protein [Thermomicrobiaceae bacterium CFH 74404]|uniref:ATP-grasp domain-containing protein n=1 Tax=Thermalbibacter longus TaxID=2951981 RepID=A0AA41WB32_9BACT|nr:biotin carboxylase N-terminal domain-containing protein [Thermalbibacter longus]MCM8749366.1 ATP-grasp domain-containing protein [Thermalbibacter longus]